MPFEEAPLGVREILMADGQDEHQSNSVNRIVLKWKDGACTEWSRVQ